MLNMINDNKTTNNIFYNTINYILDIYNRKNIINI